MHCITSEAVYVIFYINLNSLEHFGNFAFVRVILFWSCMVCEMQCVLIRPTTACARTKLDQGCLKECAKTGVLIIQIADWLKIYSIINI